MKSSSNASINFFGVVIIFIVLFFIGVLIRVAKIPENPFAGKYMSNPPYLVGDVDTGVCIKMENFDTAIAMGRDVYSLFTGNNSHYEMFDVDFDKNNKTGTGILHRYILTQDPALCEKIIAEERKKVNL